MATRAVGNLSRGVAVAILVALATAEHAVAQSFALPNGQVIDASGMDPETMQQLMQQQQQAMEEAQRAAQENGQNPENGSPDPNNPDAAAAGATAGVITRSSTTPPSEPNQAPPSPSDPTEKVQFQFYGQRWPEVLQWLADWAQMTLDWQQLPDDFVNLTTRRSYSVEEAIDLVNGLLLDRGYTMLREAELLRVVNVKTLDPSLVPRVRPEDLAERGSNEFVKVSFTLETLLAEQAAEEVQAMLSPNHKLTAMAATNRLEIVDAASNLRDVYRLLEEEQFGLGASPVKEFTFQYARASEAAVILRAILGLDPVAGPEPSGGNNASRQAQNLLRDFQRQMEQQQQQQQRNQRRNQRNGGGGGATREPTPLRIVVIDRHNSVMVTAPPDKMQLVRAAIQLIDIPNDQGATLETLVNRMQTYRLNSLDPVALVQTLEQVGGLDPTTRIQVDSANRSLVVHAPLADHMMIRMLVDKLDGAGRTFSVLKLKRVMANQVAETVRFMMTGQKADSGNNNNRRNSSIVYYLNAPEEASSTNDFRVDSDTTSNSLLLWANEVELTEVKRLLVQLGELDENGGGATVRTFAAGDVNELLRQLQQSWQGMGDNPLIIDVPQKPAATTPPSQQPPATQTPAAPGDDEAPSDRTTLAPPRLQAIQPDVFLTVQLGGAMGNGNASSATTPASEETNAQTAPPDEGATPAQPADPAPQSAAAPQTQGPTQELPSADVLLDFLRRQQAAQGQPQEAPAEGAADEEGPAPITITIGPDGRLVITSSDTRALDIMEQLLAQLAPAPKDWELFQLQFITPLRMSWHLEDFFMVGPLYRSNNSGGGNSLSSNQKEMRFVVDATSGTLMILDAKPEELVTIRELVAMYDKPPPAAGGLRQTKMYEVKYSTASIISEAVKDVYRDLLSATDRSVTEQARGGDRDERGGGGSVAPISGFKGKLSVGIDQVSNVVVISVSADDDELMAEVMATVELLDEASLSVQNTVDLIPFESGVDIENVLAGMLGVSQPTTTGQQIPGDGDGPQGRGQNRRGAGPQNNPFGNRNFGGRGGRRGGGGGGGGGGGRGNNRRGF